MATRLIAAGIVLLGFVIETHTPAAKGYSGFGPVAELVLSDSVGFSGCADGILVSSDARGEGMAVAEIARRDDRPGCVVHRASKRLAKSSWSGSNYEVMFESTDNMAAHLKAGNYRYLLLDDSIPENRLRPHHSTLASAVSANPKDFQLIGSYPIIRDSVSREGALRLYRVRPDR